MVLQALHLHPVWISPEFDTGKNKTSVLCGTGQVATLTHTLPSKQRNNQTIATKSHPPVLPAVNQDGSADSTGVMQNRRKQSWAWVICDLATNLFPNSKYQTEDLFPQGGKTVRHLFQEVQTAKRWNGDKFDPGTLGKLIKVNEASVWWQESLLPSKKGKKRREKNDSESPWQEPDFIFSSLVHGRSPSI